MLESEIWLDALLLRALYDRGYSSVRVKLDGEDSLQHLRDTLSSDQRLRVSVMRESEYYASQSEDIEKFVYYIGYPLLLLMALGTLLVNLSSMSASVSTRKTEIATLQALGFSPGKICVAVLLESTCLGLLGGVLGVLVVYLFADGIALSTVNDMSFSQVNFVLSTTPEIALTGIGLSVLIGLIGGFSAVYSIVKMPIVEALR